MAMNPSLKALVEHSAMKQPKQKCDQYLPRANVLDRLPDHGRFAVLDAQHRRLEMEVCSTVLATNIGRRKFLKSARDRMRRLDRLANSYGYQLNEP